MKSNYRRKSRFPSPRLPGFDYATGGVYFITINTKYRVHHFGEIREGEMVLSEVGKIGDEEWVKGEQSRSYMKLDVYQFMPDHFHGIVWIEDSSGLQVSDYKKLPQTAEYQFDLRKIVQNLSSAVRGFKSAVTRRARIANHHDFQWQRSFHDRIIRNQKELENIRIYIRNNPSRWMH